MSKTKKQCIYKDDKRNTYSFKVYYIDFYGKRKQAFRRGYATIKDAEDAMHNFLATHTNDCTMLFSGVIEQYMTYCTQEKEIREETLKTRQSIIQKHILPVFGSLPINKISQRDILAWHHQLKLNNSNLSDTYLYEISKTLIFIFKFATNFLNLKDNVAEKCGFIGHARNNHNDFWAENELNDFLSTLINSELNKEKNIHRKVDNYTLAVGFKVLYYLGLRCGELLGLTVNNFDKEKRELTIQFQYQNNKLCDLKTKASHRILPVFDAVYNDLCILCDRYDQNAPNSRIFQALNRYNIHRALKSTIKNANLKDIRVHDFRHSTAAYLHHIGATPMEIKVFLGHAKLSTTTDCYGHVFDEDLKSVVIKMNKHFNN